MHDIPLNKLIELDEKASLSIEKDVQKQEVKLDLDRFNKMKGGVINWGLHKSIKEDDDDEFIDDVSKIWQVSMRA